MSSDPGPRLRALLDELRTKRFTLPIHGHSSCAADPLVVKWADVEEALLRASASPALAHGKHTAQCIEIGMMLGQAGFPEDEPIQNVVRQLLAERASASAPPPVTEETTTTTSTHSPCHQVRVPRGRVVWVQWMEDSVVIAAEMVLPPRTT